MDSLNKGFFFPNTGCLTKAKEPNLPNYLLEERKYGFLKAKREVKCQQLRPGLEFGSILVTITIALSAPPESRQDFTE